MRGWFTTRPDRARRKWRAIGSAMFAVGLAAVNTHFGLVPIPPALAGLVLIDGAGTTVVPAARENGPSSCRQHVIPGFAPA